MCQPISNPQPSWGLKLWEAGGLSPRHSPGRGHACMTMRNLFQVPETAGKEMSHFYQAWWKWLGQSTRIRKTSFSSYERILVHTRVGMGLSSQTSAQAEKTLHSRVASMCLDSSPEKGLPGHISRSFWKRLWATMQARSLIWQSESGLQISRGAPQPREWCGVLHGLANTSPRTSLSPPWSPRNTLSPVWILYQWPLKPSTCHVRQNGKRLLQSDTQEPWNKFFQPGAEKTRRQFPPWTQFSLPLGLLLLMKMTSRSPEVPQLSVAAGALSNCAHLTSLSPTAEPKCSTEV